VVTDSGPGGEQAARDALKSLVQCGMLRRSDDPDHWQFAHVLSYRFAARRPVPIRRFGCGWGIGSMGI
jgi:hypothetical protein